MFLSLKQTIIRILTILVVMTIGVMNADAKPLTEKDRLQLADIARRHYETTMMDGASVYRFKGRNILLITTEVKKSPNAQRVGQVKASRAAGEYLQSATNKSVTVYEVSEGNSYSFKDKSEEHGSTSGTTVSDEIEQGTADMTTTETQEHFSDKVVQSSMTRVGRIEPLCRLGSDGTNVVFAYFMIIE